MPIEPFPRLASGGRADRNLLGMIVGMIGQQISLAGNDAKSIVSSQQRECSKRLPKK
jgi:hypothetical protein